MDNFEKYAAYTKAAKWDEICELNNVQIDSFGTKKELRALPEYLDDDEVVFALTSGIMSQTSTSNALDFGTNTWLVVLTTDRFLFLDAAMLSSSVDTQSIRHENVQAVSASQGFMLGKIMVDLGSRVITIDNCQKATVKVIADLANKWIKELSNTRRTEAYSPSVESASPLLDLFERIDRLFKIGALTEEEVNDSKRRLLNSAEFKAEKARLLDAIPQQVKQTETPRP